MNQKKKACHRNDRLSKDGETAVTTAKRLADSGNVVNILANLIQMRRVTEKMYREHMRVK